MVLGSLSMLILFGAFLFSWSCLHREEKVQFDFSRKVSDDSQLLVYLQDMESLLSDYRHDWDPRYLDLYLSRSRELDGVIGRIGENDGLDDDMWGALRRVSWFNESQRELLTRTVASTDLFLATSYILEGLGEHKGMMQRFFQKDIDRSAKASFALIQAAERRLRWMLLLLVLAIALIVFSFLYLLQHLKYSVSRSLDNLEHLSRQDWQVADLQGALCTEFVLLFHGINHVKRELYGYVQRLHHQAETEQALVDARMLALRSQVNPHFLFNALHQIGVASLVEGPEVVMSLVEATGGILHYCLDMGEDMVSLDEEMEIVSKYLYLQRSCHERNIETRFSLGSSGPLPILPMSIQPLVENCMKHGFREQGEEPFLISVEAHVQDHDLIVSVRDNGVGFSSDASPKGSGIGLANIRGRLELFYGRSDLLFVNTRGEQGTEIVVTYPQS